MGDHSRGAGARFEGADLTDAIVLGDAAKRMATDMLEAEKRPLGDTIEAAAYRLQRRYGVRGALLIELRKREPREMFVSRWMAVFTAWLRFKAGEGRERYERRRDDIVDDHPVLAGIADLVAGKGHVTEEGRRAGRPEDRSS